ncbi:MAG: reprolysin-like metallopeptidase [Flavobacterium sp.]|jgi:chitodextrinase|uniref:reprolysin-like metallopeptidase n=1 Tax=Flavobacterium sp. TaxID=239 RepID=UPI0022C40EAA|nr:zinc-dependent metalloprotease family protein [Flavobacterium sp.]MCZ8167839.1 M12 family metallo-peptidase [Flavobacterium sp.]MCZ8297628.1 M12 family metallo-peptidase [Flavobacterium sp.]
MKYRLLTVALLAFTGLVTAQQKGSFWSPASRGNAPLLESRMQLPEQKVMHLRVNDFKAALQAAPQRNFTGRSSAVIVEIPNSTGAMERFQVFENSNMDPALAAQYPEIKSYIGYGVDHPTLTAYFSVSPLGFKSMVLGADRKAEFIEPLTEDLNTYTIFQKGSYAAADTFRCLVDDEPMAQVLTNSMEARPNADDGVLRTYRLALSCTGEYTAYFGGTKALALAAVNNTMTRVNGVFENDFNARMVLIANTDLVIYTDAATDPYTTSYNSQLQSTLTSVIGDANYDVGHLFVRASNNGNAGCIGCICASGKGSAFTSSTIPTGDTFDIDYVAHEMGHQFGANHTFSMSNEGTGANMEPGSGSTIMGYAGITSQDVQPNSDAYFHAFSIQQVTNNIKAKTCSVNTPTGNAVPTANAGLDYTIPRSTPFILTGAGSDSNGDVITYNWEQFDNAASTATGASSAASATRTSGPTFRSYNSSTSPVRYFPRMQSILAGATTTAGTEITVEALPSVARTMNFRLTVRDNRVGGGNNNSDDMIVTVNGTAGPFTVTAPNTVVSYTGGSSQTITWNVAGTTANGVNCANVDIMLSTDGGSTWSTLLAATPNDGTQVVTIPNTPSTTCRIMVKGTNHIFFDVSNANFTITSGVADTQAPTAPTLSASGTTGTSTNLSWTGATDNVAVTGYDVFQGATLLGSTVATTFAVTGLTPATTYSFTVRAKDAAGNVSVASNAVSVTTTAPDTTAPTAPTLSASGTTSTSTNLSWTGATDNVAVTGYDVFRGTTLIGSTANTTFAVTGLTAATTYTFNVRAKDAAGNVSVNSNTVTVTTLTASVTYCASQGNSTADERIGRVQLRTINNASTGTAGYEDFTAISTNLVRGVANTITITPTWTATVYREGYAVFIDLNRDGDFLDTGERVFSRNATTTTPVSGSFTIPTTAALGTTRMRVSMKYNGVPTACEIFGFGQVEDYTVNITATARAEESTPELAVKVYPNPVRDVLYISDLAQEASYRIVNVMGQEVQRGTTQGEGIEVQNLAPGTYLLEVSTAEGSATKRFIKQ